MDGMDMGGMSGMGGGMDQADEGLFTAVNRAIACGFWYGVLGCVGLFTIARIISVVQSRHRRRLFRHNNHTPSKPHGWLSQVCATTTAVTREMSYPQPIVFTGRFAKYFTPLPLGRWLILLFYWTVILCFLWSNTILKPNDPMYAYKWEKVGFRAAWVSVTQIPFIYLLSCKFNPISLLTGISYERFNWLHRWAARTVFLTIIVHWSFFFREWYLADFVAFELQLMPMVKYGFGAWGVITWMVLSGFGWFRNLNYELFVIQHIAAAAVLLWLLYIHVPGYAQYNIWMSAGFLAFDWGMRVIWGFLRNTHYLKAIKTARFGYSAHLEPLQGDMVRLTIDDVDFNWRPGQHAYIVLPKLRPFESHPFTIANGSGAGGDIEPTRPLTMIIQARSGFTKSLRKAAQRSTTNNRKYWAFLSGPWGTPPDLLHYDTVVLIACSTGATFTLPLLQDIIQRQGCVREVVFHWIIRDDGHFSWFRNEFESLAEAAEEISLRLQILVHVTQDRTNSKVSLQNVVKDDDVENPITFALESISSTSEESSSLASLEDDKVPLSQPVRQQSFNYSESLTSRHLGRPAIDSMIRPAVEEALGETAVVVCGGISITAQTRTFVAALSDERAVHKGTGAQGIFLFTETYGW